MISYSGFTWHHWTRSNEWFGGIRPGTRLHSLHLYLRHVIDTHHSFAHRRGINLPPREFRHLQAADKQGRARAPFVPLRFSFVFTIIALFRQRFRREGNAELRIGRGAASVGTEASYAPSN